MPEIDTSNRFDMIEGTIAAPAPTSVICTSTPRMTPSAAARSASMPTRPPVSPWKLIGGVRSVATLSTPADLTGSGKPAASVSLSATPGSAAISGLGFITSAEPCARAVVASKRSRGSGERGAEEYPNAVHAVPFPCPSGLTRGTSERAPPPHDW